MTTLNIEATVDKMRGALDALDRRLVERRTQLHILQVALISRTHIILHGNPGNAKSMTVDGLLRHLPGLHLFKTQAFKASTPEQFLGPISFKAMEQDEYRRIVTNRFADCHVAYIDEVPRAPRAILPAFQGGMVEREFDNGNGPQPIPLMSFIGTSNHLPDDDELQAFFDRFAWKLVVKPPQSQDGFKQIIQGGIERRAGTHEYALGGDPDPIIELDELVGLQEFAPTIDVPGEILDALGELWANLLGQGIEPSIRRYNDLVAGMQAAALLAGRSSVQQDDILLAQHSLWTSESEIEAVYGEVSKFASEWERDKKLHLDAFTEQRAKFTEMQGKVAAAPQDADVRREARNTALELAAEQKDLRDIIERHVRDAGDHDTAALGHAIEEIDRNKQWITDRLMGGIDVTA